MKATEVAGGGGGRGNDVGGGAAGPQHLTHGVHGKRGALAKGVHHMTTKMSPVSQRADEGADTGPVATDLRVLNGSPEPAEARLPRCRHCHVGPATHHLRALDPATGRLRILDLCPGCHSVLSERMHPTNRAERRQAQRAAKRARVR